MRADVSEWKVHMIDDLIEQHIENNEALGRQQATGLQQRYRTERTDGSSAPGGKHHGCPVYVLDLKHDPHARVAMRVYIDSCRAQHPQLAVDLALMLAGAYASVCECGRPQSEHVNGSGPVLEIHADMGTIDVCPQYRAQ